MDLSPPFCLVPTSNTVCLLYYCYHLLCSIAHLQYYCYACSFLNLVLLFVHIQNKNIHGPFKKLDSKILSILGKTQPHKKLKFLKLFLISYYLYSTFWEL